MLINFIILISALFIIIESSILHDESDARYDCRPDIWYNIMSHVIVHFINFIMWGYVSVKEIDYTIVFIVGFILNITFATWSIICIYDPTPECAIIMQTKYGNLWSAIQGEIIVFYIRVGMELANMLWMYRHREKNTRPMRNSSTV